MKNTILIIFFWGIALNSYAQKEGKVDYIVPTGIPTPGHPELGGDLQHQINFNLEPPTFDSAHYPFRFHITHASVCDSSGNLLLYTNGTSIANGQHQIIEGGDSLQLHLDQLVGFEGLESRIAQGALFLPSPANNGIYYLFHEEHQRIYDWVQGLVRFRVKEIYLTTIDMNANGGLGKVVEKNKIIAQRDSLFDRGRILAVRHANGRDWWVVIPQYASTHLTKFLVTPAGVLTQPDIVIAQRMFPAADPEQAAFSPDGTKYATSGVDPYPQKRYFYLFDFDRCTGELYNQVIKKPPSVWLWGVFFSPDSRYLYWIHKNLSDVTQYDLQDPDWYVHGEVVYQWDNTVFPVPTTPIYGWNGPDGRIYIPCGNGVKIMHRINQPNRRGTDCEFERNIEVPSTNYVTLPNFPNYRLGPIDGSSCDTLGLNNDPVPWFRAEQDTSNTLPDAFFTDLSYHEPATWLWDFGDGTVSQDTSPVHVFPLPGVYQVCLTVSNVNGSNTQCQPVWVTNTSATAAPVLPPVPLQVEPNPFGTYLSVTLGVQLRNPTFRLYDTYGRVVREAAVAYGITEINTTDIAAGLYFWEVTAAGERIKSGKVVKVGQ